MEDDDRCSQMATTVTPENVSREESLIKTDTKMTHAEFHLAVSVAVFTTALA